MQKIPHFASLYIIWAERDFCKFLKLRNKVTNLIRESKSSFHYSISDKLKSGSLSSRDWWNTLKYFISPKSASSIPPLVNNGTIHSKDYEKTQLLNTFFTNQTYLDGGNAFPPDVASYTSI